jgi:hypothetical protein
MPLVNGKLITAAEAIAKGLCPETGADLTKVNPIAELRSLWKAPIPLDKRGDKARERKAMLEKFISDHNVRTTNMPKPAAAAAAPLP